MFTPCPKFVFGTDAGILGQGTSVPTKGTLRFVAALENISCITPDGSGGRTFEWAGWPKTRDPIEPRAEDPDGGDEPVSLAHRPLLCCQYG